MDSKSIKSSLKNLFSLQKLFFFSLFIALVFIGNKINFSQVVGSNSQYFTLFQFFGPISGAFLGPVLGSISVLLSQLIDFALAGKEFTLINVLRIAPMIFAAYYFGSNRKLMSRLFTIIIPMIAIILFIIHPVGKIASLYGMFWFIPIIINLLPSKYSEHKLFRSFGATFTAHAVGSVIFIYTISTEPGMWLGLIPTVIMERTLFALGIAFSYFLVNGILNLIAEKSGWSLKSDIINIDKGGFWHK